MKVNSREFQRDFARMKKAAARGETVTVISKGCEFVFKAVKPRTWQGALQGKGTIVGNIFNTGVEWNPRGDASSTPALSWNGRWGNLQAVRDSVSCLTSFQMLD